jgi:hypothetical protein
MYVRGDRVLYTGNGVQLTYGVLSDLWLDTGDLGMAVQDEADGRVLVMWTTAGLQDMSIDQVRAALPGEPRTQGPGALTRVTSAIPELATYEEVLEAETAGADTGYFTARYEASHAETMEALRAGASLRLYGTARGAEASHDEVLEAHRAGAELGAYSNSRLAGANHSEVLAALAMGIDEGGYSSARIFGATHAEAVTAHEAGADLDEYSIGRDADESHAVALAKALAGAYRD